MGSSRPPLLGAEVERPVAAGRGAARGARWRSGRGHSTVEWSEAERRGRKVWDGGRGVH
jgi:hypothetical protein